MTQRRNSELAGIIREIEESMRDNQPLTNGTNGRAPDGTFTPGNDFGRRGSPHAAKIAAWRKAFAEAVTEDDIRQIVGKLKGAALAGEPWAIKEILGRCIGDVHRAEASERLEKIEAIVTADDAALAARIVSRRLEGTTESKLARDQT
ncbi:MAG: hypothetical protein EA377_13415 [Phycisphaerales bacterium]|nr:MAG: hypothetical protein EA377_13415 [Phycisphaerales bacterium]